MILDVGTKTQELFAKELAPMKLIVWNGPMGVFEMENYAKGTEAVAKAVADSDAVSIVGGGDSVSAVNKTGLARQITPDQPHLHGRRRFPGIPRRQTAPGCRIPER